MPSSAEGIRDNRSNENSHELRFGSSALPMTADIGQFFRAKASVDVSRSILPSSPKYSQQFSQIYFCRINQLKRALREKAEETFPGCCILEKTLDLPANSGTSDHVLIGCLYCELPSKPDVLKDLDAEVSSKFPLFDPFSIALEYCNGL